MRFFRSESSASSSSSTRHSSSLFKSSRRHQRHKYRESQQEQVHKQQQQPEVEVEKKEKTSTNNTQVRGDSQLSTTSDSSFSSSSTRSDSFSTDSLPNNNNNQDNMSSHKYSHSNRNSTRSTVSSTSSINSNSTGRTSLASFSQLACSMSYKNRNPTSHSFCTNINTSTTPSTTTPLSMDHPLQFQRLSSSEHLYKAPSPMFRERASTSNLQVLREMKYTEANMTALQTRRAFQQMVLSMHEMEDEASSNYSDADDSASEAGGRYGSVRRSSVDSINSAFGVVQVNMEDYRKFQFRLRQLEELCTEQAKKQANMEEIIEKEVELRTKKVVEAMENKIAMYKEAKELECERYITQRLSAMAMTSGDSNSNSTRVSLVASLDRFSINNSFVDGASRQSLGRRSSKRLDRILHPRRSKQRLEREEQQRKEMEQFREFIRSTERQTNDLVSASSSSSSMLRSASQHLLDQALLGESDEQLYQSSTNELVNVITVLRKHVSTQDAQLEEAKRLINAAIEGREEAEETAREAVELTIALDSRLERASQEIVVIKDELRRSTLTAQDLAVSRYVRGESMASSGNGSILYASSSFGASANTGGDSANSSMSPLMSAASSTPVPSPTPLRHKNGLFGSETNPHSMHRLSSESRHSLLAKAT